MGGIPLSDVPERTHREMHVRKILKTFECRYLPSTGVHYPRHNLERRPARFYNPDGHFCGYMTHKAGAPAWSIFLECC